MFDLNGYVQDLQQEDNSIINNFIQRNNKLSYTVFVWIKFELLSIGRKKREVNNNECRNHKKEKKEHCGRPQERKYSDHFDIALRREAGHHGVVVM